MIPTLLLRSPINWIGKIKLKIGYNGNYILEFNRETKKYIEALKYIVTHCPDKYWKSKAQIMIENEQKANIE